MDTYYRTWLLRSGAACGSVFGWQREVLMSDLAYKERKAAFKQRSLLDRLEKLISEGATKESLEESFTLKLKELNIDIDQQIKFHTNKIKSRSTKVLVGCNRGSEKKLSTKGAS